MIFPSYQEIEIHKNMEALQLRVKVIVVLRSFVIRGKRPQGYLPPGEQISFFSYPLTLLREPGGIFLWEGRTEVLLYVEENQ